MPMGRLSCRRPPPPERRPSWCSRSRRLLSDLIGNGRVLRSDRRDAPRPISPSCLDLEVDEIALGGLGRRTGENLLDGGQRRRSPVGGCDHDSLLIIPLDWTNARILLGLTGCVNQRSRWHLGWGAGRGTLRVAGVVNRGHHLRKGRLRESCPRIARWARPGNTIPAIHHCPAVCGPGRS